MVSTGNADQRRWHIYKDAHDTARPWHAELRRHGVRVSTNSPAFPHYDDAAAFVRRHVTTHKRKVAAGVAA